MRSLNDRPAATIHRRAFLRHVVHMSTAGAAFGLASSGLLGTAACEHGPLAPERRGIRPALDLSALPDATPAFQAAINDARQRGVRTLSFQPGAYRLSNCLALDGIADFELSGTGVTLFRSAPATSFFRIVGCRNVKLSGFTLQGGFTAADLSTGGDPAIMIGTVDRREERGNSDIEIFQNVIAGSNWSGINVFGNHGARNVVKNTRISIHDNLVCDSSAGIIVYKNAAYVTISSNTVRDCAQDGIGVDTRAGTDPAGSEATFNVNICDNVVERVGRSQQGIGINLKGDNRDAVVERNTIRDTGALQDRAFSSYGIVVNHDTSNSSAAGVQIRSNVISTVAPKGDVGVGIYVGSYAKNVTLDSNQVCNTKTGGIVIMRCSGILITNNVIDNVTLLRGAGIQVDGDPSIKSENVRVSGNQVSRGQGVGTFGVYFGYSTACSAAANRVAGFPTAVMGVPGGS